MILAADFGGTTIKLGLVRDGSVVARRRLPAAADRPMPERLEAVAIAWEEMLEENGIRLGDCSGAALALPFLVDSKRPRVLGDFGKFPGAADIDFEVWSRERLGLPVALENDLRVAILGEWAEGAARGLHDVVMFALGTGIGCAAISGDRLFRGANNRAASLFGHSAIAWDGSVGRCGNIGCVEDMASTATLPELARALPEFTGSALADAEKIDFETLFTLARQGDACAQALQQRCLDAWSVLVLNAVLAYDPAVVVLGGGVLRSRDIVITAIEQHLRRCMPAMPLQIPIVAAALGDDAALLGCEVLLKQTSPLTK